MGVLMFMIEDLIPIIAVLVIGSSITGIVFAEMSSNKNGNNNRCVKSIILSYQIITNSSLGYKELRDIFDNSRCFSQLREGNELFLNKGVQYNLVTICSELLDCDVIEPDFKETLKLINDESIRILLHANRAKKLY